MCPRVDMALAAIAAVAVALLVPAGMSNPGPPHLVLLLDVSASMASQNRIEKMRIAVRGWIENQVPDGIELSIWKFTNDAREIKSTMIDRTPESRQEIINSIPEVEGGTSCIGCAIETVLKQVNESSVILITDGIDKFLEQDLKDLRAKIESSQCKIFSGLMGNSLANIHLLEELSERPVSHVSDSNSILGLLDIFQTALQIIENFSAPINIFEEEFTSSEAHFNATFSVDTSVAQNVCINLYYWPYSMPFTVDLTTPKGDNQQIPITNLTSGYVQYCLVPQMIGQWKFHFYSFTFNKFAALQVTAKKNITDAQSAITFKCWIEKGENYSSICGSIGSGKYFINTTKISVDVIAQNGEVEKQELFEAYSGNIENYSRQNLYVRKHFNITEPGYYSARCWAAGQIVPHLNVEPQHFTRVAWAGTFQVNKTDSTLEIPSLIKDLLVVVDSYAEKCSIVMKFTVPRNAIKYKLFISSSLNNLITSDGLILATVPEGEGTKENIAFKIPSTYLSIQTPLYIALSALGDNGVEGEVSNIVPVMCFRNQTVESTTKQTIDHFQKSPAAIQIITPNHNLTSHENSSSTPLPSVDAINISQTTFHTDFRTVTGKPSQESEPSISIVTEASASTLKDFTLNTSDVNHNASATASVKNNEDSKGSIGAAGIVGIVALVLLIIAAAGVILYQNIYNRKRSKYEIAARESNTTNPNNENEEL